MAAISEITLNGITAEISIDDYASGKSLTAPPWRNVTYIVDFDDSDAFMDELLGFVAPATPGDPVTRKAMHQYPGDPKLYCVEASKTPLGTPRPGETLISAPKSLIRARYEVPRFDILGLDNNNAVGGMAVPFSSWDVQGGTRIIRQAGIVDETTGEEVERPFMQRVLMEEISVTFEWVPYVYLNVYRLYNKSVNDAVFLDWAIGCVLFDQYTLSRQFDTAGNVVQRLRLLFLGQSVDWNTMPKEDDLGYHKVKGETSGDPPYPYRNLEDLLH